MGKIEKLSIALPPEMIGAVKAAVASGEYATTSEVNRDAQRDRKLKRRLEEAEIDELRRLVREGIDSGASVDVSAVGARLRAKYAAMAPKGE
jgi:antitoxin ParD1/3/4